MRKVTGFEKLPHDVTPGERGVIPCPLRHFLEYMEKSGFEVDWSQFIADFTA